jgi:5-oxoprolinase (ATP-hydrolysing) subunit A
MSGLQKIIFIDLNCDIGEGMQNDEALMPFISSANIACGFHAGDEETIKRTIELCLKYNVAIGAHPGFHDKQNFGRTEIKLTDHEYHELIIEQLEIIDNLCIQFDTKLHHVKPHGALYNMAAKDQHLAAIIANTVKEFDDSLMLYGLSGSRSIQEAKAVGLRTANEVFADRHYEDDGSLTPRSHKNALIETQDGSLAQVLQMINHQKVKTRTGNTINIKADTICIHGDGKHAIEFAQHIHSTLVQNGISIKTI